MRRAWALATSSVADSVDDGDRRFIVRYLTVGCARVFGLLVSLGEVGGDELKLSGSLMAN